MKKFMLLVVTMTLALFICTDLKAQNQKENKMKTYVIEREIPGVGKLSAAELKSISQSSCNVLKGMNGIKWVHSYVTGDKIYCVYEAEHKDLILDHAKKGGFPANSVSEVASVISPATAE